SSVAMRVCWGVPLLLLAATPARAANILALFSTFSPSHLIVHMAMMQTLADAGHNITVVTALKPKLAAHENITVVLASPTEQGLLAINQQMEQSTKQKLSMLSAMLKLLTNTQQMLGGQLDFIMHPNLRDVYEQPQIKFDLLWLGYFLNEFSMGIAAKLDVPVIMSWVGVPFPFVDEHVGNVCDPTYVPGVGQTPLQAQDMTFSWRLRNYFNWLVFEGISYGMEHHMQKYYSRAFSHLPESYMEAKRRTSLLFYNYHSHSEGPVRPTVPQSIEIGGVQIKDQPAPLPAELRDFLDNGSEGVIFFSLGTNIKASFLGSDTVRIIYNVLSRQAQRVIWKWDDSTQTPGNATNIYFHSWLPQDDILAHPKIKLFITHAGKGGVAEAQYHGVPMLALPVFADQPGNADAMVKAGFGLSLDVQQLSEQQLEQHIQELLSNATYTLKVKKFSQLYRDRPLTARQSVVFWTEYVLRHKGAYHLQSPRLHLSFVARHNLDVYAAILSTLLLCWLLLRFVAR
ncbi:Ugt36Bb, partial [Drosophila busckii]